MENKQNKSNPFSIRLSANVNDQFREFCELTGQSKTNAIERALIRYMRDYEIEKQALQKLMK